MEFKSRVLIGTGATLPTTPGWLVACPQQGQGQTKTLKKGRGIYSGIPTGPLVTYRDQHPHGSSGRLPKVLVITFFVGVAMGVSFGSGVTRIFEENGKGK